MTFTSRSINYLNDLKGGGRNENREANSQRASVYHFNLWIKSIRRIVYLKQSFWLH